VAARSIVSSGLAGERRVCLTLGVPRSSVRYKAKTRDREESLRERIKKLAKKRSRYGYRRIWATLRREGREVHINRVHRLWREESLQIRRTSRNKHHGPVGEVTQKAKYPNHVWTYDVVHDSTEKGSPIKVLN
jgi:putative transposase